MDTKPANRHKAKNKKSATPKPKTSKKRKTSDGPTCSMFLAELTRKFSYRKKQEEEEAITDSAANIVHSIIESLTNVLITFSKKSPEHRESPMKMETLHSLAPELIPSDTVEIKLKAENASLTQEDEKGRIIMVPNIDKMPVSLDAFKPLSSPIRTRSLVVTEDAAVNTGGDFDVAEEIFKHVGTLRKISLIAEEFNQKTAKNLKEIVDSVQEDLIKKLEQIQAEQKAKEAAAFAAAMLAEENFPIPVHDRDSR